MLNLSDKELDRFSKEAAQEYEPGDVLGPRSWDKLEVRINQEFGHAGWNPLHHIRRFSFYYTPALVVLLGVAYYFVRTRPSSGSSPGGKAKMTTEKTTVPIQNPNTTDKATSTPATSSADAAAGDNQASNAGVRAPGVARGADGTKSAAGTTSAGDGKSAAGTAGAGDGKSAAGAAGAGADKGVADAKGAAGVKGEKGAVTGAGGGVNAKPMVNAGRNTAGGTSNASAGTGNGGTRMGNASARTGVVGTRAHGVAAGAGTGDSHDAGGAGLSGSRVAGARGSGVNGRGRRGNNGRNDNTVAV